LKGFDAVFLSFGNYGKTLTNGSSIPVEVTQAIADYLYDGGYLYEDCGSFFGYMAYFDYSNLEEMMELFGVDTLITTGIQNEIDTLSGLPGSVAEGLVFTESSQSPSYYIDIMPPDSNGIAMFEENDYGIVAVQGEGEYGQKTVCFSYSIAHLEDSAGSRDLLMARIAEFFELLSVDVDEPVPTINNVSMEIYPNPVSEISNIQYTIHNTQLVRVGLYDINGQEVQRLVNETKVQGQHSIQLDVSELPSGIYFIRLNTGSDIISKKVLVVNR
jgi:hypothetical protein